MKRLCFFFWCCYRSWQPHWSCWGIAQPHNTEIHTALRGKYTRRKKLRSKGTYWGYHGEDLCHFKGGKNKKELKLKTEEKTCRKNLTPTTRYKGFTEERPHSIFDFCSSSQWSDYAESFRFSIIPRDGDHTDVPNTTAERPPPPLPHFSLPSVQVQDPGPTILDRAAW